MFVTDTQFAALRAGLAGDKEEHLELLDQLGESGGLGYKMLAGAAFVDAVDRRFARSTETEVIEFVADMRIRIDDAVGDLDPRLAERVILSVHNDDDIADIHGDKLFELQHVLLAGLIGDEGLSSAELDETLNKARQTVEDWMSKE